MNALKTILTAACMVSLAVGLCHALKPSHLFEKQVRFLISLLFVIGLVSPILNIDWRSALAFTQEIPAAAENPQLETQLQAQLLEETAARTETALRELLALNGIRCTEMDVSVHIDEMNCICISEVSIVSSDVRKTTDILQEQLGEEVTIHAAEMAS